MSQTLKIRALCFAVVFASVLLCVPSDFPVWLRLTAVLSQALVFAVLRRRTLISFALSYFPAILLMGIVRADRIAMDAIIVLVLVTAAIILVNRFRQPQTRPRTRVWVGSLLLAEIFAVEILLLVL